MNTKTIKFISITSAVIVAMTTSVMAQSSKAQDGLAPLGELLGSIAQASAKAKAKKKWAAMDPQVNACVGNMFSAKNVTLDQIIDAGLAPNHQTISPVVNFCQVVLTTELKANFSCMTPNSRGEQVPTVCSEVYARDENGGFTRLTRDEFIRGAGAGEKVLVATLENIDANAARLQEEKRQAAADRERFLASPEGKKQAAAEALRASQEQASRRRIEAAEIARAKTAAAAEAARAKISNIAIKSCDSAMDIRHKGNAIWSYLGSSKSDFFKSIYGNYLFFKYAVFYPEMDTIDLLCIASPVDGRVLKIVQENRVG